MKNSCFILIGLLTITVWGCNEVQETGPAGYPDMTLTIKNVRSEAESITLTLNAEGEDKDMYIRWGVTYSDAVREITDRIIKQDPQGRQMVAEIWNEAMEKGGLEDLPSYVDKTARLLDESQKLNFKRWKILDQKVHMNFQALGSYEAEVAFLKNCVEERLVKFDQYVKNNK